MTTATPNVFISYARADGRAYAERLHQDLTTQGIRAWRDERDLNPYQDFTADIENAIKNASHVAVCLTENSLVSEGYVRRELNYAILLKKPIIPLRFHEILPPIQIANLTWIDAFGRAWDSVLHEIRARLARAAGHTEHPQPFNDPFADYLKKLYEQVVDTLDETVFSEIVLHSKSTPDAVITSPKIRNTFQGAALSVKKPEAGARHFEHFADAFHHYDGRLLLLGEPGSGKTTTLMAFTRDAITKRLSDPSAPLPVFARIPQWDSVEAPPLDEWLGEQVSQSIDERWKAGVQALIQNGRALLILDGLDELGSKREIHDPDTQEKVRFDPRKRFIHQLPTNNPVITSCRINEYADMAEKIALKGAVTLAPLNDAQIQDYLTDHPDLWEAMLADDALREVARTPLLLSIFTYAYAELGDKAKALRHLSNSPGDLRDAIFRTYVERRYEHEKLKPHVIMSHTLEEMYEHLGKIAAVNVPNWKSQNIIPLKVPAPNITARPVYYGPEAWRTFGNFPHTVLDQAVHLAILRLIDTNTARFVHLLLRDHFAFMWSMTHLHNRDENFRRIAAFALAQLEDVRAIEPMIAALEDPDKTVKKTAIFALWTFGDKRALSPLIEILRKPDKDLRQLAAIALSGFADVTALESFIRLLADPDPYIRLVAVGTIGRMKNTQSIPPLITALGDSDPDVRNRTIIALGKLDMQGEDEAANAAILSTIVTAIIPLLRDKARGLYGRVDEEAARALRKLHTTEALTAVEAWRRGEMK